MRALLASEALGGVPEATLASVPDVRRVPPRGSVRLRACTSEAYAAALRTLEQGVGTPHTARRRQESHPSRYLESSRYMHTLMSSVQEEVEDVSANEPAAPRQDFAQFEVRLLKSSGRRLVLGQVTVPRELAAEGFARAREVAEAVAALTEKPLQVIGEERRRRRRRRRRSATPSA